ncbi:MAG: SIR2 family protein [Candidatus Zixiibacteriota bacterium]|nr:MAG: SIR2 family protein [candidate division Zixibacteria bacterium]
MTIDTFLRLYSLRAPNIMWFLGAGASSSAGLPTAINMIWDFKRLIYCTKNKIPIETCRDLNDSLLKDRLQKFFDSTGNCPAINSNDEYAFYFEKAYPNEKDRRTYIDRLMRGATPSYGHLILATLLKLDKARIVWTTNFDKVLEDAIYKIYNGTSDLLIATLDTSAIAIEALAENRWPLLIKLHGDFHSRRLKNIPEELKRHDDNLRDELFKACLKYGLAVSGYSGRDDSIMEIFEKAIEHNGFRNGLFWFHPSTTAISPRIQDLILKAKEKKIEAYIIECETFDELLGDIINLFEDIPTEIQKYLNMEKPKIIDVPVPKPGNGWPLIRFNAFLVTSFPNVCRLIKCNIGGIKEVNRVIEDSNADVIATRRTVGVLAFGSDTVLRNIFEKYDVSEFDLYSLEKNRLFFESGEYNLIYSALGLALCRNRPVNIAKIRNSYIAYIDADESKNEIFQPLRKAVGVLCGKIPNTEFSWMEAIAFKLEQRLGKFWLLIEPTIFIDYKKDDIVPDSAKEFVRERLARRYNREWNEVLEAWGIIITDGHADCEIEAFEKIDGINAKFGISNITAFSRKQK